MSDHEQRLANCIEEYEETASDAILNTWYQLASNTDAGKLLQDIQLDPDSSIDDIIDMGIKVSESVLEVYRVLAKQARGMAKPGSDAQTGRARVGTASIHESAPHGRKSANAICPRRRPSGGSLRCFRDSAP